MIRSENSLLLVVDFQERLMSAVDGCDFILTNANKLIRAVQILDVPILITEQYPQGLGPTVSRISSAFPPGAIPRSKKTFSCCPVPEIRIELIKNQYRNVILCGVETHVCVLQTALDLIELGKDVFLIADAVGSRSSFDSEIALRRMQQEGVKLASTEMILFELCKTAEHPAFKQISNIVKETPNGNSP